MARRLWILCTDQHFKGFVLQYLPKQKSFGKRNDDTGRKFSNRAKERRNVSSGAMSGVQATDFFGLLGNRTKMSRSRTPEMFRVGGMIYAFPGKLIDQTSDEEITAILQESLTDKRTGKEVAKNYVPELQELNRSGLGLKNSLLFGEEGFRELLEGGGYGRNDSRTSGAEEGDSGQNGGRGIEEDAGRFQKKTKGSILGGGRANMQRTPLYRVKYAGLGEYIDDNTLLQYWSLIAAKDFDITSTSSVRSCWYYP